MPNLSKTKLQVNSQELVPEFKYDSVKIPAEGDDMNDPSGKN